MVAIVILFCINHFNKILFKCTLFRWHMWKLWHNNWRRWPADRCLCQYCRWHQ